MKYVPEKIKQICADWFTRAPFFSEFLNRFKYISTDSIPTVGVAVDKGTLIMIVNEEFFNSLPPQEQQGVLVHEIMHLITLTHDRIGNKLIKIINVASDICINEEVIKSSIGGTKLEIPENGCFKSILDKDGYTGNLVTEEIYSFLYKKAKENSEMGETGTGDYQTIDDHSGHEDITIDEMSKIAIEDTIKAAKMRNYGNISSNLKATLDKLTKSQIKWQNELKKTFRKLVAQRTDNPESSWTRYNRRSLPLPGKKYNEVEIVIAVDTSGSTFYYDLLKDFFGEIESMLDSITNKITLIQCDCDVQSVATYEKGQWKNIKICGQGGTRVQPVFDYMRENKIHKKQLIYFTDGEFCYDYDTYGIKTVWVTSGTDKIPGGKNIQIRKTEEF